MTGALLRPPLRGFVVAAAAGLFMASVGAFGSGFAPPLIRYSYWVGMMLVGAALGFALSRLVERTGWTDERPFLHGAVLTVVLTIPLTAIVWLVTSLAFRLPLRPEALIWFAPAVFIVNVAMVALNLIIDRKPVETHAGAAGAPPPRFLDRLPVKLRGAEIYAVQAEDHYLRLHTSKGTDLILMRLSDAVAELEGIEGAQTHRSWWVAKDAVSDARRGDGRAVLTLRNGVEAPVSRGYARTLRQEGWF